METEETKSGISMMKPTSLYSSESEKIKPNWFCQESSMGIYDEIKESLGERLKKYKIDDESPAGFSIYMAKKKKGVILQKLSGRNGILLV